MPLASSSWSLRWPGLLALVGALLCWHTPARAFCRATTCDPADPSQDCERDARGCLISGQPLFWASGCVTINLQAAAAPAQGIDYEAAEASLKRAIGAWRDADCSGERPSIQLEPMGAVSCDQSEYNRTRANANIVMFREQQWPYAGAEDALGLTRLRFDPATGEIWDADIELNAVSEPLSVGEPVTGVDLDSLLTHEVGHLLGLAHTLRADATMLAGYERGDDGPASLEPDDVQGICAIYPPDREPATSSCEPRHGFSEQCGAEQPAPKLEPEPAAPEPAGCRMAISQPGRRPPLAHLMLLSLAVALARRRRAAVARVKSPAF